MTCWGLKTVGRAQLAGWSMCQASDTLCPQKPGAVGRIAHSAYFHSVYSEHLLCARQPRRCWAYSSEQNRWSPVPSQPGRGDGPLTKDLILSPHVSKLQWGTPRGGCLEEGHLN